MCYTLSVNLPLGCGCVSKRRSAGAAQRPAGRSRCIRPGAAQTAGELRRPADASRHGAQRGVFHTWSMKVWNECQRAWRVTHRACVTVLFLCSWRSVARCCRLARRAATAPDERYWRRRRNARARYGTRGRGTGERGRSYGTPSVMSPRRGTLSANQTRSWGKRWEWQRARESGDHGGIKNVYLLCGWNGKKWELQKAN